MFDVMSSKDQIENLNKSFLQEGLNYDDVTPMAYTTPKEKFTYMGFRRKSDGATVQFGRQKGTTEADLNGWYCKRKHSDPNYAGFQTYEERVAAAPQTY